MHAIDGGHEEASLALLDAAKDTGRAGSLCGATGSINGKFPGFSPLHLACLKGLDGVVHRLLAVGASAEKKDAAGATPLLHACKKVPTFFLIPVRLRS